MKTIDFERLNKKVREIETLEYSGTVCKIIGLTVESLGPASKIGDMCKIYSLDKKSFIYAEVVGFKENMILLMPFGKLSGIGLGSRVVSTNNVLSVPVGTKLKGRILDGLGRPIDGGDPITPEAYYSTDNAPPNPLDRKRITTPLALGIKAIDALLTCGVGQRIGIFAGSGVGKSTLLGMIARNSMADINVITLVGERGREVREFIEKDLRSEGLKKSVLVVATSDQPAIVRLKSAMIGTSIAEYFRDCGYNVLLLMDSLTRFAMAQREIGMAIGEPPVSRGYTPSVFNILPKLLERSGNSDKGSITGLYTVLVEGDDMNEPISDSVRGILDGHIVLSRELASQNHYPAIDVLESVSRVMPDIIDKEHLDAANIIKNNMSIYRNVQDLINIGAYKPGTNKDIDYAVKLNPLINGFLKQKIDESYPFEDIVKMLKNIVVN